MTKMADESSSTEAPPAVEVSSQSPSWGDFLADRDDATIYHDPRWGQLFHRVYGLTPYYLTARRGNQVTGVLQLIEQKSLMFGHHLCSLPWFDSSGILARTPADADVLVDRANELRRDLGALWVELRQESPVDQDLPVREDKVTLILPLPEDREVLWDGFKAKVRNQIRKAEKAGIRQDTEPADPIEIFYQVYSRTMRGLGSPAHSKRLFREMSELFADEMQVFITSTAQGEPAAVALGLRDGGILRNPWAGSDWSLRAHCPNMLSYWSMMSWACEHGLEAFDFGRSSREAGTYRFKKQWGAEEVQLHWQFLMEPEQELPELRPDSGKYRMMVSCWRKLPLWLTRLLGPRIIRKLS